MKEQEEITLLNSLSFPNVTFEQWEHGLNLIYEEKNRNRLPSDMWLRTVSDASKVGEAIRKTEYFEAMQEITHTFAWVISTCHKLFYTEYQNKPAIQMFNLRPHTSITGIITTKYPMACPYCGGKHCRCKSIGLDIAKETKKERRARLIRVHQEARLEGTLPKSVVEIFDMFYGIYREVYYDTPIEKITFHFLEEIGEVAWCITNLQDGLQNSEDAVSINVQLGEELADTIAWGFAIIAKLYELTKQLKELEAVFLSAQVHKSSTPTSPDNHTLLPGWLWHVFSNPNTGELWCPTCHHGPCAC